MLSKMYLNLMGLLLASNVYAYGSGTIWFERADYPSSCLAACGPVLGAVDSCDALHKSKTARLECICDWTWASSQIPLCAACISKYGDEDDSGVVSYYHYNDDDDSDDDENKALVLVNSCSLTTTTYNAAAATTLSYTVSETAVAAASATGTESASTDAASSGDDSSSSTATQSSSTESIVSTTTAAGGAAKTLAPEILRAAALVGMVAFL